MGVPKRKTSKSSLRSRIRSHGRGRRIAVASACPQCGAQHESHRACPSCGYYRGRQVVTIQAE